MKYNGKMYKGKKRGRGEITLFNGDRFKCNFKDDMACGKGILFKTDGTEVWGIWRNDKFLLAMKKK